MTKIMNVALVAILTTAGTTGCAKRGVDNRVEEQQMPAKTIEDVLKQQTDQLMSLPGVVGTAQGLSEGKPCIKVYVVKKTPELEQKIPHVLSGYPVVVEATGQFKALDDQD